MNNSILKSLLANLPIFEGLSDEEFRILAFIGKNRQVVANNVLYAVDDVSEGALLLVTGRVRLIFNDARADVSARRGMLLNEGALFSTKQFDYSIQALEAINFVYFSHEEFAHLMEEFPEIGVKIQNNIVSRLKNLVAVSSHVGE